MDNNESTRPVCNCCGATIETDDYYTFEGSILCDDCYHSETVVCEHCGDRIWTDDNAGTDGTPLCKGDNPLALYHYETCGLYVYASTEAILDRALTRLGILSIEHQKINMSCGDILKIDSTGAMERGMFDTTNLMMYDYRYFRRDWWNVPESCESEPQDVKQLKDFASSIGVSREDIDLLLSYGYFVEEIEEMLYQPGVIEEALCEIMNECAYDYCGEL